MTTGKCIYYLVAILATHNIVVAKDASQQNDHGSGLPEYFDMPLGEKRSEMNFFGSFPPFPGFGSFPGFQNAFKPFTQFFESSFSGANSGSSNEAPSDTASSGVQKRSPQNDHGSGLPGYFDMPLGEKRSEMNFFGSFPPFPGFGSFPGFQNAFKPFTQFFESSLSGANSRSSNEAPSDTASSGVQKRSPVYVAENSNSDESGSGNQQSDEEDHQSRLFFSSLFTTRIVSCNYTTQAGNSCASCRQALTCFPSNVGRLRTCHGFFPYCNDGRCSLFQGSACSSSTTTTTTTTTQTTTQSGAETTTTG